MFRPGGSWNADGNGPSSDQWKVIFIIIVAIFTIGGYLMTRNDDPSNHPATQTPNVIIVTATPQPTPYVIIVTATSSGS